MLNEIDSYILKEKENKLENRRGYNKLVDLIDIDTSIIIVCENTQVSKFISNKIKDILNENNRKYVSARYACESDDLEYNRLREKDSHFNCFTILFDNKSITIIDVLDFKYFLKVKEDIWTVKENKKQELMFCPLSIFRKIRLYLVSRIESICKI